MYLVYKCPSADLLSRVLWKNCANLFSHIIAKKMILWTFLYFEKLINSGLHEGKNLTDFMIQ